MIIDVTGIALTPGNCGKDCRGNGLNDGIECCCDECDYLQCCLDGHDHNLCLICTDRACPRSAYHKRCGGEGAI